MERLSLMDRPLLLGLDEEFEVHPNGAAAAVLAAVPQIVPAIRDGAHHGEGWATAGGGIFYLDYHERLEFAGPECTCPAELLLAQQAGDRVLERAARALETQGGLPIRVFRASVDDVAHSTAGSHTSTLFDGNRLTRQTLAGELTAWSVVSRLLTGAGGFDWRYPQAFALAARPRFTEHVISSESTYARGINHTREESLVADHSGLDREHYILEDCNRSGWSVAFRFLRPVLIRLLEGGVRFHLHIKEPLSALHAVTADPTGQARLLLQDGRRLTARELLQSYLERVRSWPGFGDFPEWVEGLIRTAEEALQGLAQPDPEPWNLRLDWAIKQAVFTEYLALQEVTWADFRAAGRLLVEPGWYRLLPTRLGPARVRQALGDGDAYARFDQHRAALGLEWEDLERLHRVMAEVLALNKRYHELGPKSLYAPWRQAGLVEDRFFPEEEIEAALTTPPSTTRAQARGQAVAELAAERDGSWASWTQVRDRRQRRWVDLGAPFQTEWRWQPEPETPEKDGLPEEVRRRLAASRSSRRTLFDLLQEREEDNHDES